MILFIKQGNKLQYDFNLETAEKSNQIPCRSNPKKHSLRVRRTKRRTFGNTGMGGCPEDCIMRCRIVPEYLLLDDLLLFPRYVTWPTSAFPAADSSLMEPRLHGARLTAPRSHLILGNSGPRISAPIQVSARRIVRNNGAG